jgi:hypothetical protein
MIGMPTLPKASRLGPFVHPSRERAANNRYAL